MFSFTGSGVQHPGFGVQLPPDLAFKILRITLEGIDATGDGDAVDYYMPRCLTPQGHDFLEAARDDTHWKWAKKKAMEQGLPLTGKVLWIFLQEIIRTGIRKYTGGE